MKETVLILSILKILIPHLLIMSVALELHGEIVPILGAIKIISFKETSSVKPSLYVKIFLSILKSTVDNFFLLSTTCRYAELTVLILEKDFCVIFSMAVFLNSE